MLADAIRRLRRQPSEEEAHRLAVDDAIATAVATTRANVATDFRLGVPESAIGLADISVAAARMAHDWARSEVVEATRMGQAAEARIWDDANDELLWRALDQEQRARAEVRAARPPVGDRPPLVDEIVRAARERVSRDFGLIIQGPVPDDDDFIRTNSPSLARLAHQRALEAVRANNFDLAAGSVEAERWILDV